MDEEQPKRHSILDIEPSHPQRTNMSQGERLEEALEKSKDPREASLRPLKTYQSDVAEAIKRDNVSVIKIALAEKRRQDKEVFRQNVASSESKKGIVFLISSIALIVLGLGILGYFYFSLKDGGDATLIETSKDLIYAERSTEINIDSEDFKTIPASIAALKQTPLSNGVMENIVITKKDRATSTIDIRKLRQRKITAEEFIDLFNSRIPGPFLRSLSPSFMLGLYKSGSSAETFLILKTDSYGNAFAGMLQWEKDLQRDMGVLFSIPDLSLASNAVAESYATSSGSSSTSTVILQSVGTSAFAAKPFEDRVIENRDTRVLTDQSGKVVFLYSFIDPETLVFATSPNTFNEIVARTISAQHSK